MAASKLRQAVQAMLDDLISEWWDEYDYKDEHDPTTRPPDEADWPAYLRERGGALASSAVVNSRCLADVFEAMLEEKRTDG